MKKQKKQPNPFYAYINERLSAPRDSSMSGDVRSDLALARIRKIQLGGGATFGETHGSEVVFGEGSPGFDPQTECTKGGPYENSPWCVSRMIEAFDETITRTEVDVRKAVRDYPELKQVKQIVEWGKIYSDWKDEEKLLLAQVKTAKDNSEWYEQEPDDADESAINQRIRLEQWFDRTRDIRNDLLDGGLKLRPAAPTPEEIKKTYGETPKSDAELAADTAKYIAVGAVAVAGIYALGLFKSVKP